MSRSTGAAPSHHIVANLELIGPIVRLQVQTGHLKQGEKPRRWYDPAPIRSVPVLRLEAGGVTGLDGDLVPDVHHRDHPISRFRGDNGVSVGLTGHYRRMRERFGEHMVDGIAGENILVDADPQLTEEQVAGGVVILTAAGPVSLTTVFGAPPCVEFSRFCAQYARDRPSDRGITETLRFLSDGMRGFYATLLEESGSPVEIAVGDVVFRKRG